MHRKKPHLPTPLGRLLYRNKLLHSLVFPCRIADGLRENRQDYISAHIPPALDGLRIVFASDIHYGCYFEKERALALAARLNACKPDILLFGGDYGDNGDTALRFWQEGVRPFETRYGAFAVLGNHDMIGSTDITRIRSQMRDMGVTLLENEFAEVLADGCPVSIYGTGDYYTRNSRLEPLADRSDKGGFSILLSHTPDVLPDWFNGHDKAHFQLALCGHTHGGQVAVAGKALRSSSLYGNRYNAGWKREKDADILISMGVGTSFLPVRLGTRAEYHVITLRIGKD